MDAHLNVCSLYLYIAFSIASAEFNISNYIMSKFNNTEYGEMLGSVKALNKLECFSACSEDRQCNSATFDITNKMCHTNRLLADPSLLCDEGDSCSGPDVIEYAERNSIKTTIRLACHNDAHCVDPKSLCVLGKCVCEPGYSYNGTSCACVTSCASYGTTFQADYGSRIVGNNVVVQNNVTVDDCASFCVNETSFVCKTFEYGRTLSICSLQIYTALDMPAKYTTNSVKDLYTRDCSP